MSTPKWQPGTLYIPGSIVVPRSSNVVTQVSPNNPSFESGLTHWAQSNLSGSTGTVVATSSQAFDGSESAMLTGATGSELRGSGSVLLLNDFQAPVKPGQTINFSCRIRRTNVNSGGTAGVADGGPRIYWYNASHALISFSTSGTQPGAYIASPPAGTPSGFTGGSSPFDTWVINKGSAIAPAGAAYAVAAIVLRTNNTGGQIWADYFTWDYTEQGYPPGLDYTAVQANPGTSGSNEPVWPITPGATVVDNGVTWQAGFASQITWQASSILTSGASEPTWPTKLGAQVVDNNIVWTATDGRVTDSNCPQSKIVAIAAAKVFAADADIIRFSATANAQDWSSSQDAGFIPFGLQSYGNEDCLGLGLYRSNLVAFNTLGYQMWQVDPDPSNMAILDAEPVGSGYHKSIQPVNNDLVFLSPVGIRNIGTAGATGNLQAGMFGKAVDPIVRALVQSEIVANGYTPRALFNPGTGQYWLILGHTAIVLTINGANTMSWSRYTFPSVITDWTLLNSVLYLRTGDLVWFLDDTVFVDDSGGTNAGFRGYMAWNYLSNGQEGVDKEMEGFDLTIGIIDDDGTHVPSNNLQCSVTIGYNQSNNELATDPYTVTGDTVPGQMIPIPMTAPSFQLRLDFGSGQNWGWSLASLYIRQLVKM